MDQGLDGWIERMQPVAVASMLRAISATDIVKARPGFGQTIRPLRGSVVASPVPASYDPDPDYFFHWYRDSAVVMDALRLVDGHGATEHFCDFVAFSLDLDGLDGKALVTDAAWRDGVAADYEQFVREEEDLAAVVVRGETRVNPDGSLDISRWNRPQYDGIAARVLTCLRWWAEAERFTPAQRERLDRLVADDLAFLLEHWREPSFDIWEEEKAHHYYTLSVQAAALREGAPFLEAAGPEGAGGRALAAAAEMTRRLNAYWHAEGGYYRSRLDDAGAPMAKDLDIAVILAAIHAGGNAARHSPADDRVAATLDALDRLFEEIYPINHGRPAGRGPALGRYRDDIYYSGGAYYFSTLGAAEFCFRRAHALRGTAEATAMIARGDGYLETIRAFTPADGEMSEQFDKATGEHTSAKHLAWSYAGFIATVAARRVALSSP